MEKTIATLTVIVSDELGAATTRQDGTSFTITIRRDDYSVNAKEPDFLGTTLAHELGHFVARITHDKTHQVTNLEKMLFGPQVMVPAEKKAWQIAHKIRPSLNRKIESYDLGTYENG